MATAVTFTGTISIDGGPPRPFTATGVTEPLTIWGGPIIPPPRPEHPIYYPPGSLPHPEHPIVIIPPGAIDPGDPPVPAHPIYLPVYPAHPIVLPPDEPPPDPGFQWVYTDQFGWVLDPVGGGKPRPLPPSP